MNSASTAVRWFAYWEPSSHDDLITEANAAFTLGRQRTVTQDAAYGLRQLVDVALKALSPGINDTTTATTCIDFLGAILARLVERPIEAPKRSDEKHLRLIPRGPTFAGLLREGVEQIRQNAESNVAVLVRLLEALWLVIQRTTDTARQHAILEQVQWIAGSADRGVATVQDRATVHAAAGRVREAATSRCEGLARSPQMRSLGFLLFAGALHVRLSDLLDQKWVILALATIGLLLSTLIVGVLTSAASRLLGLGLRPSVCLLFGALISPTDPIAVLALLRQAGAPKSLSVSIAGESLFHDGVGVVVFLAILETARGGEKFEPSHLLELFLHEAMGGVLLGLVTGYVAYRLMKSIDQYQVEVLITLATVAGGYSFAQHVHASGPIAMVIAGLIVGNQARSLAMSDRTRESVDMFWELIDEVLNAVLFLMIGLEVILITLDRRYLLFGALATAIVLLARFVSVAVPLSVLRLKRTFPRGTIRVFTWGGLRGGISVASRSRSLATSASLSPDSARCSFRRPTSSWCSRSWSRA